MEKLNVSYHNIKKLNISLVELYSEKKQIRVHLTDSKYIFTLVLIGRDKEADFLLSSFAGNYFCRSYKGINRLKYTSLTGIDKAVKRLVKNHICNTSIVSYSLSEEINLF